MGTGTGGHRYVGTGDVSTGTGGHRHRWAQAHVGTGTGEHRKT